MLNHVKERGVRLGDQVLLRPFWGRSNQFQLNRTSYSLGLDPEDGQTLKVLGPGLGHPGAQLFLEAVTPYDRACEEDEARFVLRSAKELPFRLNGSYVFHAYLERGDKVEINSNHMGFSTQAAKDEEEILEEIDQRLVHSSLSILLEGETGTGKSHLAKKIHFASERRGPFVHLNLSALSSSLIESELFGHVKGAFTGAVQGKLGAFGEASDGTLFLDEIDSLSLDLQTKLLLFLDNGEYRPVGGNRAVQSHTRLIFASGRSLSELVKKKLLREDFYYRLHHGPKIKLKPLRDDPLKFAAILARFEQGHDCLISSKLKDFYQTLPWPGNYRQLLSHLRKKILVTKGRKLDFDEWDEELMVESSELCELARQALKEHQSCDWEELKACFIQKIYWSHDGQYSLTAKKLRMSLNTVKKFVGARTRPEESPSPRKDSSSRLVLSP